MNDVLPLWAGAGQTSHKTTGAKKLRTHTCRYTNTKLHLRDAKRNLGRTNVGQMSILPTPRRNTGGGIPGTVGSGIACRGARVRPAGTMGGVVKEGELHPYARFAHDGAMITSSFLFFISIYVNHTRAKYVTQPQSHRACWGGDAVLRQRKKSAKNSPM